MTLEMRTVSQSDFVDLASNSLTILDIRPRHFRAAANLSDNIALGIRAPDALHLAVAVDNGATLCTLDKKLAAGAAALGAKVNLLSPAP